MITLTAQQFVDKWGQCCNESQSAQTHFNDLCALVGHPDPVAFGDPDIFNAEITPVNQNRVDVFYRRRFIWKYKGRHADLDTAYQQLLFYKDALDNPPLLITSDTKQIIIHTNYPNTSKQSHVITLDDIKHGSGLRLLKTIFNGSVAELKAEFKPKATREAMTQAMVEQFINIVEGLRQHGAAESPHCFIRLLFCLFAQRIGLLTLFSHQTSGLARPAEKLTVLFDYNFTPPHLDDSELRSACRYDWSELEPSIFGMLFERVLDGPQRHQRGAHYTSRADIELIIEPVLMQPLRAKWQTVKAEAMALIHQQKTEAAASMLQTFADKIAATKVLDPACGSGNFLYIALQHLLDLQKEVLVFAKWHHLPPIPLTVAPRQLHGLEINVYAHELAQVTVWIGYLQWCMQNGFQHSSTVPRPVETIKRMDAILAYDDQGQPVDPPWPKADVIIGNPPFLGSRKMRPELGNQYCDELLTAYSDRIEGLPDLVCYWFDKARRMVSKQQTDRVGLLATQAIRGGANRQVLEKIGQQHRIFMAWSDKAWVLAGATVHVSLIAFDKGTTDRPIMLNGQTVPAINADLTSGSDLIQAEKLLENRSLSFQGVVLRGQFNMDAPTAQRMLRASNRSGVDNRAVLKRRSIGRDITGRLTHDYVVDFGTAMSEAKAQQYELPYQYLKQQVYPTRQKAKQAAAREAWWVHWNPRITMRHALSRLSRYIATPRVGKHRLFVWLHADILPDNALVVFAREDDYFFGVLHSTPHELWARRMGTQLRDAVSGFRYTPTTCFQTFPLPWPPGTEPSEAANETVKRIAELGRQLVTFRQGWLHPEEPLLGDAVIKKRTLTNLYNALEQYRAVKPGTETAWAATVKQTISLDKIAAQTYLSLAEIERLAWLHAELDRAVLAAYGWPPDLSEEQILEKLLALNLARFS